MVTALSLQRPNLFYGAAASFRTLGVTTLLRGSADSSKEICGIEISSSDEYA